MTKPLGIIGAGGAGMAAGLLAQSHGIQTTLFESHIYPGGCASWFERGPFVFDVGATTLSGIGIDRPLTRWSEITGAPLRVFDADPGIVFHFEDEKLVRYRDSEQWLSELHRVFPHINHRKFWNELNRVSLEAWKFLPNVSGFPPRRLVDLTQLGSWMKGIHLLPYLFTSLSSISHQLLGADEKFKRWMDALCMISAQNRAEQVPALIGALALTYPAETYAPVGGMKGLFVGWLNHFEHLGGVWKPKHQVKALTKAGLDWKIQTDKSEEEFKHVISNLTGWNLSKLLKEKSHLPIEAWSAFTIYAAIKPQTMIQEIYHLVMADKKMGIPDYFVSFSHHEDLTRAPKDWQTVTISIHTHEEDWKISGEEYKAQKKELMDKIWGHFLKTFGPIEEVKFLTAGTPQTFMRYTGREGGRVGGLPHRWSHPLWMWPSQYKAQGLTQLGDTVFPGQGLVAVVTGALQWWEKFKSESQSR